MVESLVSKSTNRQIGMVLKSPPPALLITGVAGSGKRLVAEHIASKLLKVSPEKLREYPYLTIIEKQPGKQEISIDSIRQAVKKLNLKAVINAKEKVNRVVLLDGAHLASAEAQNALLKAIEEPPAATIFILTAVSDNSVLPTIASRAQRLKINPISLTEAQKFYKQKYGDKALLSAWQLSGGAAGLLAALLKDDQNHPLKQSVEQAKKLLGSKPYERALALDDLSASKPEFIQTLDALERILSALYRASIKNGTGSAGRLLKSRQLVAQATASLQNNASPKLVALNLSLKLPI